MDCSMTKNEIELFMREFADDYESKEMLRLLGRHPYCRFNLLALADSLDMKPKDIGRTLNRLQEKGLVRTIEGKATALYALTENESWRDLITKTAALDYRQMATLETRAP
jgi:DNA-binding MarR family transcriptional regulator